MPSGSDKIGPNDPNNSLSSENNPEAHDRLQWRNPAFPFGNRGVRLRAVGPVGFDTDRDRPQGESKLEIILAGVTVIV